MTEVTKESMITGKANTMDIRIDDPARITLWLAGQDKRLVQDAFPDLSPNEREFLMNGITPEEWDKFMWSEEPEDEDVIVTVKVQLPLVSNAEHPPVLIYQEGRHEMREQTATEEIYQMAGDDVKFFADAKLGEDGQYILLERVEPQEW